MERETELEERQRHDQEIADDNRARQIRQGVISESSEKNQENKGEENQEPQEPAQYQGGEIPQSEKPE